ncbi:MAG TPA: cytochrome P450 [Roseiflexaceae bacterium]|nr:cytochrome P450 [Roseiflexaceae bacterium]
MTTDQRPPGPNAPGYASDNLRRFRDDYGAFLRELTATYGDIVALPVGQHQICLLSDPASVQQVFAGERHSFQKPEALHASNRGYWGDGLTSLEGAAWLRMRRLLQPAFHPHHLARFAPVIVECAQDMLAGWQPGAWVDVTQASLDLVARIAARTVLDADVEGHAGRCPRSARAGLIPAKELRGVQFAVTLLRGETDAVPMMRPRAGRRPGRAVEIIKERLASREDRGDMLSRLLRAADEAGHTLSADEVLGEMIQMLFAGHLNFPRALAGVWQALAEHPEAERGLHAEVDRVLGGRPPQHDDLPNLPYTEMVIKEALRRYTPSGLALHREVTQPVQVGSYTLEPGTIVWVDLHLLHHDPRLFAEPERFWPERFGPERERAIPRYAFLPFGAGPRTCIGNGLAMMQMQLIVTVVAQSYRLALPPDGAAREAAVMEIIERSWR